MLLNETNNILSEILKTTFNKEKNNLKVCFVLTHIPNPRINKRIKYFLDKASIDVICIRRKSQNIWEPEIKNVNYHIYEFDMPPAKKIIKRYITSKKFQEKALSDLDIIKPDLIYTASLDSLMVAYQHKKSNQIKVYYEVADLRESFIEVPANPMKWLINKLILLKEKDLFKIVDKLIVTSMKFYDLHYYKLIKKENVSFIPNAPDPEAFKNYKKKNSGTFTIGFIGGIRYIKQMKMLVDASEIVGCNVLFAGAGSTDHEYNEIIEYCKDKQHVTFSGKYNYTKDIANLYSKVDCVYAVYDADNPNVRIALPNKLYEAMYCNLPIIVAKNTYLSELVEQWRVGVSVSHKDINDLINTLLALKNNWIKKRDT